MYTYMYILYLYMYTCMYILLLIHVKDITHGFQSTHVILFKFDFVEIQIIAMLIG